MMMDADEVRAYAGVQKQASPVETEFDRVERVTMRLADALTALVQRLAPYQKQDEPRAMSIAADGDVANRSDFLARVQRHGDAIQGECDRLDVLIHRLDL